MELCIAPKKNSARPRNDAEKPNVDTVYFFQLRLLNLGSQMDAWPIQLQQVQLVEASVRHRNKTVQREEKVVEVGRSIEQLRKRFSEKIEVGNELPPSPKDKREQLDDASLELGDVEMKKSYQDALQWEHGCG